VVVKNGTLSLETRNSKSWGVGEGFRTTISRFWRR
jgi:hypothetical protein